VAERAEFYTAQASIGEFCLSYLVLGHDSLVRVVCDTFYLRVDLQRWHADCSAALT